MNLKNLPTRQKLMLGLVVVLTPIALYLNLGRGGGDTAPEAPPPAQSPTASPEPSAPTSPPDTQGQALQPSPSPQVPPHRHEDPPAAPSVKNKAKEGFPGSGPIKLSRDPFSD